MHELFGLAEILAVEQLFSDAVSQKLVGWVGEAPRMSLCSMQCPELASSTQEQLCKPLTMKEPQVTSDCDWCCSQEKPFLGTQLMALAM